MSCSCSAFCTSNPLYSRSQSTVSATLSPRSSAGSGPNGEISGARVVGERSSEESAKYVPVRPTPAELMDYQSVPFTNKVTKIVRQQTYQ